MEHRHTSGCGSQYTTWLLRSWATAPCTCQPTIRPHPATAMPRATTNLADTVRAVHRASHEAEGLITQPAGEAVPHVFQLFRISKPGALVTLSLHS